MGLGDIVSGLFGSKNKFKASAPTVDPNAYQYGGRSGGAEEAANRYRGVGDRAQTRGAEQANNAETAWDRMQGQTARMGQNTLANAMTQRALGGGPSVAQMQADRQMQQAQAAQASQASSARGAGAMALAQQGAANNMANAAGAISGQAQINAAQERRDDTTAAFGAQTGIRGGDMASQTQAAQQAQFQAQMNAQQRAQNDLVTQQNAQNEMGVNTTQLGAGMNQQAQQSANSMGAQGINSGVGGQNASMNQANAWGALGAIGNVAGGLTGGGGGTPPPKARKDGGPMTPGQPYLVGEEGPELVVPSQSGMVIPHEQTKQLISPADLAVSTWGTGRGISPEAVQAKREQVATAGDNIAPMNRERDARAPTTGGIAIPGLDNMADPIDPKTGKPTARENVAAPLKMADRETRIAARAKDDHGIKLSDREEYEADAAKARMRSEDVDGAPVAKTKPTLASALGGAGSEMLKTAKGVDVSYHAPAAGTYVPPRLIPLRASGGPVAGGMPFIGGEQGPELVVPQIGRSAGLQPLSGAGSGPGSAVNIGGQGGMSAGDVKAASTGLGGKGMLPGMVGGGGITGGAMNIGGVPGYEEGGVMPAQQPAVVGEKGPELVVPVEKPSMWRSIATEIARQAAPPIAMAKDMRSIWRGFDSTQRVQAMDDAAKMGLGPVAGRALIRASEEYGEAEDEMKRRREAATLASRMKETK